MNAMRLAVALTVKDGSFRFHEHASNCNCMRAAYDDGDGKKAAIHVLAKSAQALAHPEKKGKVQQDPTAMKAAALGTAISMPLFCYLLGVARVQSAGEGALWGFFLALFFDAGLNGSHNIFERRPIALTVIHCGYHAMSLLFVGAVLGGLCS
eukprot:IDg13565t1